ncbi:MAG: phage holin family protein [bacterium]
MKRILRTVLFNVTGIHLASQVLSGLSYSNNIKILALAGLVLTLASYIVKPILKIVTLPINFITFGIFSWLIDVFILFLTAKFVSDFTISAFIFNGFSYNGFVMPVIALSVFWAFVVSSFVITMLVNIFKYICD